jgi:hypothetical protein
MLAATPLVESSTAQGRSVTSQASDPLIGQRRCDCGRRPNAARVAVFCNAGPPSSSLATAIPDCDLTVPYREK